MAEWPRNQDYNRITISPASPESIGAELVAQGSAPQSAVWSTANTALFVPFCVYQPFIAKTMGVYNGTVVAGNVDVGIYDDQGNRIVSKGSTVQAGTSALQTFDITDTTLQPGSYFMALNLDNATATVFRWTSTLAGTAAGFGVYSQAVGAITLPATATFSVGLGGFIPVVCVSGRTVI